MNKYRCIICNKDAFNGGRYVGEDMMICEDCLGTNVCQICGKKIKPDEPVMTGYYKNRAIYQHVKCCSGL